MYGRKSTIVQFNDQQTTICDIIKAIHLQVIRLVAWFKVAPKENHVQAMKIIFKYLKGTLDFYVQYSRAEYFTLTTYNSADQVGNINDKKSKSGGI